MQVSGLSEIIEWVEREVILDPDRDVRAEFEDISTLFEKDGRLPLSDILQEQEGEFLEFLESKQRDESGEDSSEDFRELEQRIETLESSISNILKSITTEFGQIIRSAGDVVLPLVGSTSR